MSRCCSQCGSNGHNSRTCGESSSAASASAASGSGNGGGSVGDEIVLFGVRVKVDPMRKSVSMNNLSQYELPPSNNQMNDNSKNSDESAKAVDDSAVAGGYVSADEAVQHQSTGGRERKRGIPWTEEEHKLFLLGLQKVGKGDWRGISRNFVKTRTPTQVASHAQKYYLRRNNLNRRRRRSSLFDITTDSVGGISMEDGNSHQENPSQTILSPTPTSLPPVETSNMNGFLVTPLPMTVGYMLLPQAQNLMENISLQGRSNMFFRSVPVAPSPAMVNLNLNQRVETEPSKLSLRLTLSSDNSALSTRPTAFPVMQSFNNRESIVSVA